jgi:hypothetical protein
MQVCLSCYLVVDDKYNVCLGCGGMKFKPVVEKRFGDDLNTIPDVNGYKLDNDSIHKFLEVKEEKIEPEIVKEKVIEEKPEKIDEDEEPTTEIQENQFEENESKDNQEKEEIKEKKKSKKGV